MTFLYKKKNITHEIYNIFIITTENSTVTMRIEIAKNIQPG